MSEKLRQKGGKICPINWQEKEERKEEFRIKSRDDSKILWPYLIFLKMGGGVHLQGLNRDIQV